MDYDVDINVEKRKENDKIRRRASSVLLVLMLVDDGVTMRDLGRPSL